jgi:SepF-like predicted cell division protein (DUF552 family)
MPSFLKKSNKNSPGLTDFENKGSKNLPNVVNSTNDNESHPSTINMRTQSLQPTYTYPNLRSFEGETVIRSKNKTNYAIKLQRVRRGGDLLALTSVVAIGNVLDILTLSSQPNGHINGGHRIYSTGTLTFRHLMSSIADVPHR